ncbi:MAG: BTAD domain-containing putative transcriptional regulator [Dongiaceae bacterium]
MARGKKGPREMGLTVSLLGGFAARGADGQAVAFPTRKVEALLAVLAAAPGTAHPRERLATLLWSRSGDVQARGSLRQSLALLRKALQGAGATLPEARGEAVALDPEGLEVDAVAFERAAAAGDPDSLRAALELYRGDFLAGFALDEEPFEEWLAQERRRFRQRAVEACERLLEHCLAAGDAALGLATGERLLVLEPASEGAYRAMMRLQARQGARGAAVRLYERCRQALAADLGVEPAPETTALWREILAPAAPVPAAAAEAPPAIAVLPFAAPPDEPELSYLGDGLAEDVIRALSRFRSFGAIARHSSFALRDLRLSAPELGQRLGARYLLSGALRRSGGSLRLTADLADAESGRQLWAERYDLGEGRLAGLQEEVAGAIAGALAQHIDRALLQQARRRAAGNLQAYDCWLRGLDCVRRGGGPALEEARGFFRRALELDPSYARGHSGLSLTYFNEWNCSHWKTWRQSEESALDHAQRAVELDDGDHVTQLILGRIHLYRRDYAQAEQHLARAEALNPNDADLLAHLALGWSYLGDPGRAQRMAELAVRLNPLHDAWYYIFLTPVALVNRRFEAVVAMGGRCLERAVKMPALVAAACAHLERMDEARRYLDLHLALFRQRITFGRAPEPGEAREWLAGINAFRRPEDMALLLQGLAKAGLR